MVPTVSDKTQTATLAVPVQGQLLAQVRKFDVMTLVGSVHEDYFMLCLSYSIVCLCRVRVKAATLDKVRKIISNMSLAPVVG